MSDKTYDEFWHVRHSCRHSIYWSDPVVALRASQAPCPWCGGETGRHTVPATEPMLYDPKAGVAAFREKNPDGTIPWCSQLANTLGEVTARHMGDNSCCAQ